MRLDRDIVVAALDRVSARMSLNNRTYVVQILALAFDRLLLSMHPTPDGWAARIGEIEGHSYSPETAFADMLERAFEVGPYLPPKPSGNVPTA
jgi:hypothetical protein